jgi:hypothetical protein
MTLRRLCIAATAALLTACAGTPGPGDSGYPFNVSGTYSGQFAVEGQVFAANMELQTGPGGVVTGRFEIRQPVQLSGTVEGSLLGTQLTITASYDNNPMTGCSGDAGGTVTVAEGGASFSGPITVSDCGDMLSGTMRFSRE